MLRWTCECITWICDTDSPAIMLTTVERGTPHVRHNDAGEGGLGAHEVGQLLHAPVSHHCVEEVEGGEGGVDGQGRDDRVHAKGPDLAVAHVEGLRRHVGEGVVVRGRGHMASLPWHRCIR